MRLLNDEEIALAIDKAYGKGWRKGWKIEEAIEDGDRAIAEDQFRADIKGIIELLENESCNAATEEWKMKIIKLLKQLVKDR